MFLTPTGILKLYYAYADAQINNKGMISELLPVVVNFDWRAVFLKEQEELKRLLTIVQLQCLPGM